MGSDLPAEDVEASQADTRLQSSHPLVEAREAYPELSDFEDHAERAGAPREALEWVYFRSPASTWESLCGREGWLLLDRRTARQFAFIETVIN